MASPKIEKLLESYASGNQVKASNKLAKLATSGNPEAQFYLARIFSENGLRFLASDSWVDLLNHEVQPREIVSRNHYETLTWLGNTTEARKFLQEENLFELQNDLDERDLVLNLEKLKKELAVHILAFKKNQVSTVLNPKERQMKELEISAGLGYISSQIDFSGTSFDIGNGVIVSGNDAFEIDDSYIYSPQEYWPSLLLKSAQFLRELINSGRSNGELVGPTTIYNLGQSDQELVRKLAIFTQDIQERIFFMNGGVSASTNNEKYALSAIVVGLHTSRPVATNFYTGFLLD